MNTSGGEWQGDTAQPQPPPSGIGLPQLYEMIQNELRSSRTPCERMVRDIADSHKESEERLLRAMDEKMVEPLKDTNLTFRRVVGLAGTKSANRVEVVKVLCFWSIKVLIGGIIIIGLLQGADKLGLLKGLLGVFQGSLP
jgi:hypothetical protein